MNRRIFWSAVLLLLAGSIIESKAQSGKKYPYVLEGKYIVSRDATGGANSACIHPNWKSSDMYTHSESSAENRVAAKFEVADANAVSAANWDETKTICAAYTQPGTSAGDWRLPTQRELMLLWVMYSQNSLTGVGDFPSGWYWSATNYSSGSNYAWAVSFGGTDDGRTYQRTKYGSGSSFVRCVRDVD
ncbi:DUF1566 domain-containing protein [Alistipes sp.]|uniref:Lcl C-terminal domain-containing protein n=1 Tax=Alistipes sp. TaxID=1872444 RepID=UPI003AF66D2B